MGIYSSFRNRVGNTLVGIIHGICFSKPKTFSDDDDQDYSNISSPDHHVSQPPPPPPPTNGVSSLGSDLFNFDNTFEVPELLSEHVASSKKDQAKWYEKLLKAWKGAKPPPKTPEQASRLVMQTLHKNQKADVEGLLKFYGLPVLHEHQIDIPAEEVFPAVEVFPPPRPEGVKFELHTFPVDAYAVADGDGLTVYVDVADPREATISVPEDVRVAVSERSKARASKDKPKEKVLHKTIVDAGYRFLLIFKFVSSAIKVAKTQFVVCYIQSRTWFKQKEILAREYRIRLRGIDAPENKQPFGKEAKKELTKLVKGNCVIVHVYGEDKYNRLVGDVYCNGQFAQWAKEAKAAGIGLWADSDPEKPWEWRKNNPREEN
ncbi:hypothetical protein MKX03_017834 [Papaver bracteatum]|nr:hypothetical protein MKX03_017834 [Papaver bracteatum]